MILPSNLAAVVCLVHCSWLPFGCECRVKKALELIGIHYGMRMMTIRGTRLMCDNMVVCELWRYVKCGRQLLSSTTTYYCYSGFCIVFFLSLYFCCWLISPMLGQLRQRTTIIVGVSISPSFMGCRSPIEPPALRLLGHSNARHAL
jgi:hypothetical protein